MQKQPSTLVFSATSLRQGYHSRGLAFFLFFFFAVASAFHSSSSSSPIRSRTQSPAASSLFVSADVMGDFPPQREPADILFPAPGNPNPFHDNTNSGDMRFGRFVIPEASIFCRSPKVAAFVNLRPIVPGHVLVVPKTIKPHMADLDEVEYTELWKMVRTVQTALQQAYPQTTAFNVAVQDGKAAGQSIPHVHVHILPRSGGDFQRNDDVYDALEAWAPTEALASSKPKTDMEVPEDSDRVDRTPQAMADEAALYRRLLQSINSNNWKDLTHKVNAGDG